MENHARNWIPAITTVSAQAHPWFATIPRVRKVIAWGESDVFMILCKDPATMETPERLLTSAIMGPVKGIIRSFVKTEIPAPTMHVRQESDALAQIIQPHVSREIFVPKTMCVAAECVQQVFLLIVKTVTPAPPTVVIAS